MRPKKRTKAQANDGIPHSEGRLYPASPMEQATEVFKRGSKSDYVSDFLNVLENSILPATRSFTFLDVFHASQTLGREIPTEALRALLSDWVDTMQRLNKITVLPALVYDYETYVLV